MSHYLLKISFTLVSIATISLHAFVPYPLEKRRGVPDLSDQPSPFFPNVGRRSSSVDFADVIPVFLPFPGTVESSPSDNMKDIFLFFGVPPPDPGDPEVIHMSPRSTIGVKPHSPAGYQPTLTSSARPKYAPTSPVNSPRDGNIPSKHSQFHRQVPSADGAIQQKGAQPLPPSEAATAVSNSLAPSSKPLPEIICVTLLRPVRIQQMPQVQARWLFPGRVSARSHYWYSKKNPKRSLVPPQSRRSGHLPPPTIPRRHAYGSAVGFIEPHSRQSPVGPPGVVSGPPRHGGHVAPRPPSPLRPPPASPSPPSPPMGRRRGPGQPAVIQMAGPLVSHAQPSAVDQRRPQRMTMAVSVPPTKPGKEQQEKHEHGHVGFANVTTLTQNRKKSDKGRGDDDPEKGSSSASQASKDVILLNPLSTAPVGAAVRSPPRSTHGPFLKPPSTPLQYGTPRNPQSDQGPLLKSPPIPRRHGVPVKSAPTTSTADGQSRPASHYHAHQPAELPPGVEMVNLTAVYGVSGTNCTCTPPDQCPEGRGRTTSRCGDKYVCCPDELLLHTKCGVLERHANSVKASERNALTMAAPWAATILLRLSSGYVFVCGGVLIHPRTVLTDASCVQSLAQEKLVVRLGEGLEPNTSRPAEYQEILVLKKMVRSANTSGSPDQSVALLILKSKARLRPGLSTLCVRRGLPPSQHCHMATYSTFSKGSSVNKAWRPSPACRQVLRSYPGAVGGSRRAACTDLRAAGAVGRDQPGAPVSCAEPHSGRHRLAGIVTWGDHTQHRGQGQPKVFTRVEPFYRWIDSRVTRYFRYYHPYFSELQE